MVDSGGANLRSVELAFRRLGADPVFTRDPAVIAGASLIILPGVGAAGTAMDHLRSLGLVDALRQATAPVIGICVGMQLLYEGSDEQGAECLGLLPGRITQLKPGPGITIPQMGWNGLTLTQSDHSLLNGLKNGDAAYFVNGYARVLPAPEAIATVRHGVELAAVVASGRIFGCQFHPERSAAVGATILRNMIAMATSRAAVTAAVGA